MANPDCGPVGFPIPGTGGDPDGGGGGQPGVDVEQTLLCDVLPDGTIAGSAIAVYDYDDTTGAPTGPPTFVDPATGNAYVPQGVLQPCPEDSCFEPVPFCFTTTSTGPVDHPGRMYDIDLPINPGFAVASLTIDSTSYAANIEWTIFDPDGEKFRQDLTSFLQGRVQGLGATVTVTNPNAGQPICGRAQPMHIHIECVRIDKPAPDLIELIFNAGEDLIQNPAYNSTPSYDLIGCPPGDPVQGFHLNRRSDAGGTLDCTGVANRGWETNDDGGTFELWCRGQATGDGVSPTPRGTPTQEVNSDGHPAGNGTTIWQTFQVTTPGTYRLVVVHGARDPGEQHTIRLSTGDTDDAGVGDLLNDVTNPPSVTNNGGPNPWTTLDVTRVLNVGVYTLSFHSTSPVFQNRGGLFTDMRAYIDRPDTRATAVNDDDTCVVTVDETTTVKTAQYWAPQCEGGQIRSWRNVQTGQLLDNAAFWGQVPAPTPGECPPDPAEAGGGSVAANLVQSYAVCATLANGQQETLQRVVITDASGGALFEQFIGPDGAPVVPASYAVGACTDQAYVNDEVLCDVQVDGTVVTFLRKYVQQVDPTTNAASIVGRRDFDFNGAPYTPTGTVGACVNGGVAQQIVCDVAGAQTLVQHTRYSPAGGIIDRYYTTLEGVPVAAGAVLTEGGCCQQVNMGQLCYDAGGGQIRRMTVIRSCDDNPNPPGILLFAYDSETGTLLTPAPPAVDCDTPCCPTWVEEPFCVGGVQLLRHTEIAADGTETVTWVDVDGTPANPAAADIAAATAGACVAPQFGALTLELCDANTTFTRVVLYNQAGGIVSVHDWDATGAPYVPVGAVGQCLLATAHIFDAAGVNWTPADVPAGKRLVALSATVVAADPANSIVDSDGTAVADLPSGYTAAWSASQERGTLIPPQQLSPGGGRILVVMTCQG